MAVEASDHPLRRERAALRFALLAVLLAAPLPFGSVEPWAVATVEVLAAVLGAWGISLLLRERASLPKPLVPMLLLALVPAGVGLLQLAPLPRSVLAVVAPRALAMREEVAAVLPETRSALWPASLSPPDTLDALARYGAWVLIGVAAAASFRRPSHLRAAAVVLAASGCFQAVYGSAEYLSGRQHIFGYAKRYYTDVATGTFINRNHFAEYLALALPFALWLASERGRERSSLSWRQRLLQLAEGPWLARAGGFVAAGAIWAGVLLSASRGGLAAGLAGTALFAHGGASRRSRALALALLLPTAYLCWQELRAPGERFFDSPEANVATLGGRLPAWEATLGMVRDFPLIGSGIGTFEAAFALYKPSDVRGRWDHAHNDWLQSIAEGGASTALALLGLLAVASIALARPSPFTGRPSQASATILAALAVAALHAFVDFGLRIPAIAITVAALVGMTRAAMPGGADSLGRAAGARGWRPLLFAAPAAVAAVAVTVHAARAQPEAWASITAWAATPPSALQDAADRRLEEALALLNDTAQPPAERLAGYRERLRTAERLLLCGLAVNPARARELARLAAVRSELEPPLTPKALRAQDAMLDLASRMACEDPQVQTVLGELLLRTGHREDALPYLRRAVDLDPGFARRLVGTLRENLFRAEEILAALGPSPAVLVALRQPFEEDGKSAEYVALLEQRLTAPTALLVAAYGESCRRLGDPDRALENLGRLPHLGDPTLEAERRRQRALAFLDLGKSTEAIREARDAAAIQPNAIWLQELVGQVALWVGDGEEAARSYRRALSLAARARAANPQIARLYTQVGLSEERAGRPDRAFDAYLKALALNPGEPQARERVHKMREAAGSRKPEPDP